MAPIFFLNLGEGSGKKNKMLTGCLQTRNRDDSAKTSLDKEVFFARPPGRYGWGAKEDLSSLWGRRTHPAISGIFDRKLNTLAGA